MKELTISDDRQAARQLAQRYRCEFVELSGTDLDLDLFRSIQADLMFRYNFVPLKMEGESLVVAMADPSDLVVIDEVSDLLHRRSDHPCRAAFRDSGPAQEVGILAAHAGGSH